MKNDFFWITLSFVKGLGNIGIKKLYRQNSTADFPTLSNASFTKVVSKSVQDNLNNHSYIQELKNQASHHIAAHRKKEIAVIPISSDYYPPLLRLIKDPPAVLYGKGNLELLKEYKNIAIVGTRNPTRIGVASAQKIAFTFAQRGYSIISGLAKGIDTAAHQGALQVNGGKTIAVLSGDLTKVYPTENIQLANEILKKEGLLISESPIGKTNIKGNLVKRDRIQSGVSLSVCPVQTSLKGGTQHTIRYAKEQQRFLFTPIPLEKDVTVVQGNLELISNDIHVLKSTECYDKVEKQISNTYKVLSEEISEQQNNCIHTESDYDDQHGSLF